MAIVLLILENVNTKVLDSETGKKVYHFTHTELLYIIRTVHIIHRYCIKYAIPSTWLNSYCM